MTLSEYYNQEVKKAGYRSFNHFCAEVPVGVRDKAKKEMKKEYKLLFPKPGYKNDPKE